MILCLLFLHIVANFRPFDNNARVVNLSCSFRIGAKDWRFDRFSAHFWQQRPLYCRTSGNKGLILSYFWQPRPYIPYIVVFQPKPYIVVRQATKALYFRTSDSKGHMLYYVRPQRRLYCCTSSNKGPYIVVRLATKAPIWSYVWQQRPLYCCTSDSKGHVVSYVRHHSPLFCHTYGNESLI